MDLRSVSVLTRNIVASRTEADLLRVVCTLLVQTCNAEAVAIWLTHRNKGMTARPDHWFSTRIPTPLQSLLIDQNYVVGGLRGTGPYLKKIQALPPIDQTLQYIAAPLVFDGGIRGLLGAWAVPDQAGALPDLIDLASQLTAVRLRSLTDANRLTEQQLSIQSAQQELLASRQRYLNDERAATAGLLTALIGLHWQPTLAAADLLTRGATPMPASFPLQQLQADLRRLQQALRQDPLFPGLADPAHNTDLADLSAQLCLRCGFKLGWQGPTPCPAVSRNGAPAIFRALILELFSRMQTNQSLQVHVQNGDRHVLWGLYVDELSPPLAQWVQQTEPDSADPPAGSAALQLAHLLTDRWGGLLRFTPPNHSVAGAVLRLPRTALEPGA